MIISRFKRVMAFLAFFLPQIVFGQDLLINNKINAVLNKSLIETLKNEDASSGFVILSDLKANKVIVVKSFTNKNGKYISDKLPLYTPFEPDNLMLPISLSILFDDSKVDLDEKIDLENGTAFINRHRISDNQIQDSGLVTYESLNYHQSRVGIAKACFNYYKDSALWFKEKLNQCVGGTLNMANIPIEYLSIGQKYKIKPLDLFSFYHSLANDGHFSKVSISQPLSTKRKVFSNKSTLEKLDNSLQYNIHLDLSNWNSLQKENISYYAGMSTTLQNCNEDSSLNYYSSAFIGYLPVKDPQFCCFILINKKPQSQRSSEKTVVSTLVRDILQVYLDKRKNDDKKLMDSMRKEKNIDVLYIGRQITRIGGDYTGYITFYYNEKGKVKELTNEFTIERYNKWWEETFRFSGEDFNIKGLEN